jgi:hypothetical protein
LHADSDAWTRWRIPEAGDAKHPIAAEIGFAQVLDELMPGLDYWLHQDPDTTPLLLEPSG